MPLGKSGRHYINPHEMRRQGDEPGDKSGSDSMPKHGEDSGGDGNHHHEITLHDDGSAHSVHTSPDGQKDEQDHGSYDEAKQHMDASMGQGDSEPDGDESMPSGGDDEDMAGMYASGCK